MGRKNFEWYKETFGNLLKSDMTLLQNQKDSLDLLLNMKKDLSFDDKQVKKYAMKVSKYTHQMADYMAGKTGSGAFNDMYYKALMFEAKHQQVDSGLLYLERYRIPKERFYEPRREVFLKHNIIQSLQDMMDDELDIFCLSVPPGCGKQLADDTPILTTNGWKNHGDLVVGDMVYGMDGKPKKVLHVFPKSEDDCLITFTNGEQIQCHEDHEWVVYDRRLHRENIMETKQLMSENLQEYGQYRFKLPERQPIEGELIDSITKEPIFIVSIERVNPKRGNCIQVEGGIYCAGKTMIPTHNSTLEDFFLSLVGGWYPNDFNLSSAHSSILTRSLYDGVLEIINDPVEYAWHELFPTIKVQGTNAKETTVNLERNGRFKTWTFRSIDGSLTGATRCNRFLTADDLVSGIEEALNKSRLETLWTKVTNDLRSRRLDGCKEFYIATRWSVHDPIGKLQQLYAGNPRARFIAIPALNEDGESNFQFAVNGFSTKYFLDMKETMDEISFNCLFQQKPVEREGLLLPPDELRRFYLNKDQVPEKQNEFTIMPTRDPDAIWGVCDTKDKGTDYESLPIAYQFGEDFYIPDVVFDDNTDYATLDRKTADILIRHQPHKVRFESNQAGGRIADNIEKMIKGKCRTVIDTKYTTANKETKILVNSDWIKKHCLFLEPALYKPKSDYGLFMGNVTTYTTKAKMPHDDGIDSLAMLAEYVSVPERKPAECVDSPY